MGHFYPTRSLFKHSLCATRRSTDTMPANWHSRYLIMTNLSLNVCHYMMHSAAQCLNALNENKVKANDVMFWLYRVREHRGRFRWLCRQLLSCLGPSESRKPVGVCGGKTWIQSSVAGHVCLSQSFVCWEPESFFSFFYGCHNLSCSAVAICVWFIANLKYMNFMLVKG